MQNFMHHEELSECTKHIWMFANDLCQSLDKAASGIVEDPVDLLGLTESEEEEHNSSGEDDDENRKILTGVIEKVKLKVKAFSQQSTNSGGVHELRQMETRERLKHMEKVALSRLHAFLCKQSSPKDPSKRDA